MVIERFFTVDLAQPLTMHGLPDVLMTSDVNAHRIIVSLKRNGETVAPEGAVSAYCIRADGRTFYIAGTIEDGAVCVTLPAGCYEVPGWAQVAVKLSADEETTTVFAATVQVMRSRTDAVVDPAEVVPSLEQLLRASGEANSAAANAREANEKYKAIAALKPQSVPNSTITWARGGIDSKTGEGTQNRFRARSAMIGVEGAANVALSANGQLCAVFFFDAEGAYLGWNGKNDSTDKTVPVPENASTCRVLAGQDGTEFPTENVGEDVTVTIAVESAIVAAVRSLLEAMATHEDALVELADMIGG